MYRIIQLTDCHLFAEADGALRGVATWPRFRAVLDDVQRRFPDPDLLVLTGDTADDEQPATYEQVRRELDQVASDVRIIPGNHDDRRAILSVFPESGGELPERITFCEQWGGWRMIGLDSQIPGAVPGALGKEQLSWLRAKLEGRDQRDSLLFVHHPPIPVHSPWLDVIGLADADRLGRLLSGSSRVHLVSCGHVHQEASGALGETKVVTTGAVAPQFRPRTETPEIEAGPPVYRVFELHPEAQWSTEVIDC